eukprot:UN21036
MPLDLDNQIHCTQITLKVLNKYVHQPCKV